MIEQSISWVYPLPRDGGGRRCWTSIWFARRLAVVVAVAQQTNLEYMLVLDVDRLVWSFRKTAGLPTPGEPHGGWEDPNTELRGHFVGHYLSATALMWASTHNNAVKEKMNAVVSALAACQNKIGTGYLSAFPDELFDLLEHVQPVWSPYYTIHKHDQKHLLLAHLFDKPCFLGILAVKADDIGGFHANTHLAHVIGAQRRYEVTGDPLYRDMTTFFMDILNSSHTYATGGTSRGEFWTDPKRLATSLSTETEESCATYNMLKIARNLFRWTKDIKYADYYERALTNGVLGIQRGKDPGAMIYTLPLCHGCSKGKSLHGWGTKYESFVCCQGTGLESFSKLGDSIYFEEEGKAPGLYIIQYISSTVDWKSGKILINQAVKPVVSWDSRLQVTITISLKEKGASQSSTINLRIPNWAPANGVKATLNGQGLPQPTPGKFLSVTRQWNSGDKITLELPLRLRTEAIKDERSKFASIQAILYGPYLLAGMTRKDWKIKTGKSKFLSDWITPIPAAYHSNLISLSHGSGKSALLLTNLVQHISMESFPSPGTDKSLRTTFRLVLKDSATGSLKCFAPKDAIGKLVMLEPINFPGMVVAHQGTNRNLIVAAPDNNNSVFHLVAGLNGKPGTVSLESGSQKGCFVYYGVTGGKYSAVRTIKLQCQSAGAPPDAGFKEAVSFVLNNGTSSYHPISFVAKGTNRNFLLTPFYNFIDESYTPYFNITV
ncbi:uncharacterized protein LOC132311345 isoform X2 [Cornus florida]|uniref:uncharacterized protein LOC132311345 isoform X2 n=1 Tax=Cornus florida TaxID=4283 RepID=UPI00289C3D11|nr:uncharacterized protein LOC132311345 isoform X2 [Cornus florida]